MNEDAPLAGGYYDSEDVPAPEPSLERTPAPTVEVQAYMGKFTASARASILESLEHGASLFAAARAAGIVGQTLNNWLADKRQIFLDFQEDVSIARAKAFVSCEKIVKVTKPLDWLLRGPGRRIRESDELGREDVAWADPTQKIESKNLNANLNAVAQMDVSKLSLEKLEQLERLLLEASSSSLTPPQSHPTIEIATDNPVADTEQDHDHDHASD